MDTEMAIDKDTVLSKSQFKESNPKDSVGTKKVSFSCVPAPVIGELALALHEGALKYGRHNYRAVGVRGSIYYDACLRHIMSFWEGEDTDPDSGLPHIVKAMACLTVLRDSQMVGNWVDDRPPAHKTGWVQDQNEHAEKLISLYPDPKKAFTQLD